MMFRRQQGEPNVNGTRRTRNDQVASFDVELSHVTGAMGLVAENGAAYATGELKKLAPQPPEPPRLPRPISYPAPGHIPPTAGGPNGT